jgi:hypothetical protein
MMMLSIPPAELPTIGDAVQPFFDAGLDGRSSTCPPIDGGDGQLAGKTLTNASV